MEDNSRPVVFYFVGLIFESQTFSFVPDHGDIFRVESAHDEVTVRVQYIHVGVHVVEQDVAVDVGKDDVVTFFAVQ